MIATLLPQLIQRLPARARPVVITLLLGLAAGLAAVLFHLAIHLIYTQGLERLSHASPATFLLGSFLIDTATAGISGWLLTRYCADAAGSGIPQL